MTRLQITTCAGLLVLMAIAVTFADRRIIAAAKEPSQFQSFSQGFGGRFILGPLPSGTALSVSSATVSAQFTGANVGFRILHGGGAVCDDFALGDLLVVAAVPPGTTAHLVFPQPLVFTHPTESWCLRLEQVPSEDSQVTLVGMIK